jgi:hypothetical protein
MPDNVLETLN